MKLFINCKQDQDTDIWFAWYPVSIRINTRLYKIVWLTKVKRRYISNAWDLGYVYEDIK